MRKAILGVVLGTALSFAVREAGAFCGFYVSGADAKLFNNATQVALMREGTRTVLSMQNNYQGPPQNFAMVVPVPVILQKENVKTLPMTVFGRIDQLTAPRLVEYWEQDPCAPPEPEFEKKAFAPAPARAARGGGGTGLGVTVEAQFTVGEFEIVILSAKDSSGLDKWLRQEKYNIPPSAEPVLRPYVQRGMKFFVAKVDVSKVKMENGMAQLSPLRFHYDSETFELPVRLGLLNSSGTQDLIVNILAKNQRYEVANYPNVTIPTNIDVNDATRSQFGAFYAALFDHTVAENKHAVVTEYAWDAGSCDPCPTPALNPNELMTLGADVLPGADAAPSPLPKPMPSPMPPPTRRWNPGSSFVITRLHARYGKDTLGEDLVFRAVPPIMGGREFVESEGKLERGARPSSGVNNFQARYAIRHAWTGPITCPNPRRGVWGGPPAGVAQGDATRPQPATGLAFAPRGNVQLASFVSDSSRSELGLAATPPSEKPASVDAGPPSVTPPSENKGCRSCSTVGATSTPAPWSALLAIGAVFTARRRRPISLK